MTRGFIVWIGASGRAFTLNRIDGTAMAPIAFGAAVVHCRILLRTIRAEEVRSRLRYPKSSPNKSVTGNGKDWSGFDRDKGTIELKGLTGNVAVTANY